MIQEDKYYLLDVLRERLDYLSLRERAIAHARAYGANKIVVEESGNGAGLIAELQKASLPVVAVRPVRNKIARMQEQAHKFLNGHVYLRRHAPWLAGYQGELLSFPRVRFDDQVDSTSQALACDHLTYDLAAMNRHAGEFISALAFKNMLG